MGARDELLAEIRRLERLVGERPRLKDLKELSEFSKSRYYTEFGSWNEAVQEAGVDGPPSREYGIPDESLLAELQRVADRLGGTVTRAEMDRHGEYAPSTVEKRFGGWNVALLQAGLRLNRAPAVEVTCDECGDVFKRARAHLDRDWLEHTFCSPECHGAWREGRIKGERHPQWCKGSESAYGADWQRLREEVIQRDGEQCTQCGIAREEHLAEYGRDLHVHHIIPRRAFSDPDDADTRENTVTLCMYCHAEIES